MSQISKVSGIRSLWMGVTCVASGAAAAAMHGNILLLPLSICLLFGLSAQFAINFLHRYNDERFHFGENEADGISFDNTTPFSTKGVLREAMYGATMITAMIGITIIAMGGWVMIVFGAALVGLALLINLGRHPMNRTPWGVGLTSMAFGPIGTTAVCFLQSQRESEVDINWYDLGPAILIGLAIGFLIGNWQIIHNYAQYELDLMHNKRTFPVIIGRKGSRAMIMVNALCCAAVIIVLGLTEYRDYWLWLSAVPVAAIPFYGILVRRLRAASTPEEYDRVQNRAGLLMLLVALGLLVVFCLTGIPVDTHFRLFTS